MGYRYNYKNRKEKVEEILDNTDKVNEVERLPTNDSFTYTNGYKASITAIFVDLRDSTTLFSDKDEIEISKVIRGFTSEVIEILRQNIEEDGDLKEIGIRGDCVYAIYSTLTDDDAYEIYKRAYTINTYIKMLNELLDERELPQIKAGIGISAGEILAVKAGRKSSGINNLVWVGKAVAEASKLADKGNKNKIGPIVVTDFFYKCIINKAKNKNTSNCWEKHDNFYSANIIKKDFNDWINEGMRS
ncbi:hypothetical protein TEHN7126_1356 [Tetragenococcus halophilus subsp. halophilus]|uniref:adenylate/guanylate cyclase domain-containing protein n=1 Tax=Tetragenococcus halophilus TaxID=51669 RepID=UPI000CC34F86|nr:adenylate/guanylate cyclase domain-containing protein [Tetragenococcus halophilus]GBD72199.1 hypothetical protein TEHN7125_0359 [Tetragenococcus halophilus subsp. halophilus]GBD75657.1 hypothetical protein TEHN7126_1356 [Tetragenococcus halophilus subsp. halophilus]